jgi:hypothetical protein
MNGRGENDDTMSTRVRSASVRHSERDRAISPHGDPHASKRTPEENARLRAALKREGLMEIKLGFDYEGTRIL